MAKEIEEARMSREQAAERLETIASRLRADGALDVEVGNKTIHLSPPAEVGMQLEVRETSSMLRGSRESLRITLDWKPE